MRRIMTDNDRLRQIRHGRLRMNKKILRHCTWPRQSSCIRAPFSLVREWWEVCDQGRGYPIQHHLQEVHGLPTSQRQVSCWSLVESERHLPVPVPCPTSLLSDPVVAKKGGLLCLIFWLVPLISYFLKKTRKLVAHYSLWIYFFPGPLWLLKSLQKS